MITLKSIDSIKMKSYDADFLTVLGEDSPQQVTVVNTVESLSFASPNTCQGWTPSLYFPPG